MEMIIKRDQGIDFVKFFYIWMMIVYHCFFNAELISGFSPVNINSFLGFVSGGFPWLSGYLIGLRYFDLNRFVEYKKLAWRGVKLLTIYFISNIFALSLLDVNSFYHKPELLLNFIKTTFYGKSDNVIYDILIPLGALSIISSFFVLFFHRYQVKKNNLIVLLLLFVIVIHKVGYLYLACAIFGVLFGFLHIIYQSEMSLLLRKINLFFVATCLFVIAYYFDDPRVSGWLYVLGVTGLFILTYGIYNHLEKWLCYYDALIMRYASHSLFIYMLHVPIIIIQREVIHEYFSSYNVWLTFASILISIIIFLHVAMMFIEWLFRKNLARWYKFVFLS